MSKQTKDKTELALPESAPPAPLVDFNKSTRLSPAADAFLKGSPDRQDTLKVPLIKIQPQSGLFLMPNGAEIPMIEGFPIMHTQTRRMYLQAPRSGEKGDIPDCWSADMIVPHDTSKKKESPTCAECPHNQWKSGPTGRSKKCGTYIWIFLVNNAWNPPIAALQAPPTSIRSILGTRFQPGYFGMADAEHGAHELVWSRFTLELVGEQVVYSILHGEMVRAITDAEQGRQLAEMRAKWMGAMRAMVTQSDALNAQPIQVECEVA
jgi:hypothetical protein